MARTISVVIAAFALSVCSCPLRAQAQAQTYTVNGDKIEVRFSAEKSSYVLGEPIRVKFEVRNVSKHTLMVGGWTGDNDSLFSFEALRDDGLKVRKPQFYGFRDIASITDPLRPGESKSVQPLWPLAILSQADRSPNRIKTREEIDAYIAGLREE